MASFRVSPVAEKQAIPKKPRGSCNRKSFPELELRFFASSIFGKCEQLAFPGADIVSAPKPRFSER